MPPPAAAQVPAPAPRVLRYSALEGLLRGLEVAPGSAEYREVARLCGGTEHPPQDIPVEAYVVVLQYLARLRFPERPRPEALFEVGSHFFEGYRHTLLGKIQLAALNLVGPERLVRKTPEFLGRNSNFGHREVEQLAPRRWAMRFRGVPVPGDYYRGMFTAGLRATGAEQPVVTCRQTGEDLDFEASW